MRTVTLRIPSNWTGHVNSQLARVWLADFLGCPGPLPPDPGPGDARIALSLPHRAVKVVSGLLNETESGALRRIIAVHIGMVPLPRQHRPLGAAHPCLPACSTVVEPKRVEPASIQPQRGGAPALRSSLEAEIDFIRSQRYPYGSYEEYLQALPREVALRQLANVRGMTLRPRASIGRASATRVIDVRPEPEPFLVQVGDWMRRHPFEAFLAGVLVWLLFRWLCGKVAAPTPAAPQLVVPSAEGLPPFKVWVPVR